MKLLQCISLSTFDPPRLFNHIPGCVSVCVCSVSSSKYLCACVDKGLQVKVTFYLKKKKFPKNQNGLVCPFVDFLFHHFYFNYFDRLENGDRKNVSLFSHTNPFCVDCVVVVERKKRLGLIKPRFTADEFVNELIWKIWLCVCDPERQMATMSKNL